MEAFYETAREEGLENASIAKIAKRMGIQPSLIIHYFKTREDLIFELIEFNLEKYREIYQPETLDSFDDPMEKLLKILDAIFSHEWDALFDDGVFYSCYALTYRSKKIKESYKSLHDFLHNLLAEAIQSCQEEGLLKVGDVPRTADFIFAIVDGAYYYLGMSNDPKEYEEMMEFYKQQALRVLNIASDGPLTLKS